MRRAAPSGRPSGGTFSETRQTSAPLGRVGHPCYWGGPAVSCSSRPVSASAPNATLAHLQAQGFGVVALVYRQNLWTFPRTPWLAGPETDSVQQGQDLGPLMPIGGRLAVGQGHARSIREAVDEDPLDFAAMGHALTAAFPGGKMSRRWRRTAIESSRVPRRSRGSGPASQRGSHRPANVAATDVPHFWKPMGGAWDIAPAAAGGEHVQRGIHDLAKGYMGHPPPTLGRRRRENVRQELPFQVAQTLEASGHSAPLHGERVVGSLVMAMVPRWR